MILELKEDNIYLKEVPMYIIGSGYLHSLSSDSFIMQCNFYFTKHELDAQKIYDEEFDEVESSYYQLSYPEIIVFNLQAVEIKKIHPRNLLRDISEAIIDEGQEKSSQESEQESEEEEVNKEVKFIAYCDTSDIAIIKPHISVLTASKLLTKFFTFASSNSTLTNPQDIYTAFKNFIEKQAGYKTYSLYYEIILAQIMFDKNKQLYRLSKEKSAYLVSFKEAIARLHPVRQLFFENLGKSIKILPTLEKTDLSTLDRYLLGDYDYFKNQTKAE